MKIAAARTDRPQYKQEHISLAKNNHCQNTSENKFRLLEVYRRASSVKHAVWTCRRTLPWKPNRSHRVSTNMIQSTTNMNQSSHHHRQKTTSRIVSDAVCFLCRTSDTSDVEKSMFTIDTHPRRRVDMPSTARIKKTHANSRHNLTLV